ncbi:MAG: hypothetical protein H8D45_21550, partial [Bacteroidetes bacterium]|nr:hypothetical protein [Bacteroidota bacterium]
SGVNQSDIDPISKQYFSLDKENYGGFYVNVTNGKKYFLSVTIENGEADIYYSRDSEIDIESETVIKVEIVTNGIWFTASWSGPLYVLVVAKENGTLVSIDVLTYNPQDSVYGIELTVNDVRTDGELLTGNQTNYCFLAQGAKTYNILGRSIEGVVDIYVATRTSVGPDDYDHRDRSGDNIISIQYNTSRYVYIVVKDRDNALGSHYSIRVYSHDVESPNILGMQPIIINDERYSGFLLPSEIARFSFRKQYGNTYRILAKSISGGIDLYSSNLVCVDDQVYDNRDWYADDGISILSTDYLDSHYIAIVDRNTSLGSNYSVRVYSYDEPSASITTTYLSPGYPDNNVHLNKSEIKRYNIPTTQTVTYSITVTDHSGDTDTYLSVLSCVDEQVYEFRDWRSDDGITFLAQTNAYYVAVIDRGNELGSNYSISVSIE